MSDRFNDTGFVSANLTVKPERFATMVVQKQGTLTLKGNNRTEWITSDTVMEIRQ